MDARPERIVRYSPEAKWELAMIFDHTLHVWGLKQAEAYLRFLNDEINSVKDHELPGLKTKRVENARAIIAKWPKAKYSHIIAFEVTETELYVLRVLHTARNR